MAVGKSAVARTLARKLKRRFVDLDKVIEKREGMKVRDIFAQKGEAYFRQLEKEILAQVMRQNRQVIATGGGVVIDEENVRLLREKSWLVWLTASPEVLVKRAGNGAERPLLLGGAHRKERVEELLKQRDKNYAQAHARVDTSELTIEEVAEKIMGLFNLDKP